MDNKQLTKLANALVTKRREKRAFLGGLARLVKLLSKTKDGLKLLPRAMQMRTEMPKAWKAMNSKNMKQMLGRGRMPGMTPPPPAPGRVPGFGLGKGIGGKPLASAPSRMPSRLAPPPPISTRIPNPNFRPKTDGGMWRSPSHTGPPSPFSHPMQ